MNGEEVSAAIDIYYWFFIETSRIVINYISLSQKEYKIIIYQFKTENLILIQSQTDILWIMIIYSIFIFF